MRIATWNLERPSVRSGSRLSAIQQHINAINADVWIFTETHECVSPGTDYQVIYSEPVPTLYKYREGEHWVGIASRLPVRQILTTSTPDISVCVELNNNDQSLIMYGTVLPYHAERGWHGAQRNWEAHYAAIECQRADWQKLKEQYPNAIRCLAGDFNQTRDGKHQDGYGTSKGRELLTSALEACQFVCVTEEDMIANGKLLVKRNIDHICINSSWADKTSPVSVWNRTAAELKNISDHNGCFVDIG